MRYALGRFFYDRVLISRMGHVTSDVGVCVNSHSVDQASTFSDTDPVSGTRANGCALGLVWCDLGVPSMSVILIKIVQKNAPDPIRLY